MSFWWVSISVDRLNPYSLISRLDESFLASWPFYLHSYSSQLLRRSTVIGSSAPTNCLGSDSNSTRSIIARLPQPSSLRLKSSCPCYIQCVFYVDRSMPYGLMSIVFQFWWWMFNLFFKIIYFSVLFLSNFQLSGWVVKQLQRLW